MTDTHKESADRLVKIGIVGSGFGSNFLFHKHPNCHVEAISAQLPRERKLLRETYRCNKEYSSLKELLKDPDVDAVAIFTPAPFHASHTVEALKAGKHVLCAVPAAMTLEECAEIKKAVLQSGLTYMMAETSVYRQDTISARMFYNDGLFGRIIAADAQYHHPGLDEYFFEKDDNRPTWRHGLPPIKYSTHCTAFLISVTGERLTGVSCLGWGDNSPLLTGNKFDNPFWNETALFSTNYNTAFKVNVSWKGALMPTERCEWHGERMSFFGKNPLGLNEILVHTTDKIGKDDAGFKTTQPTMELYDQPAWWKTEMLPARMRIESGHGNSHAFITHEFISAIHDERQPKVDIEEAIAYTAPGIVAHESALRNGEFLKIPDFDSL